MATTVIFEGITDGGSGPLHLYAVEVETGQVRQITKELWVTDFAQSPDGQRIACIVSPLLSHRRKSRLDRWWLYTLEVDGSHLKPVYGTSQGYSYGVAWHPDGERISFLVRQGEYTALHVIHADGTGHRVLARDVAEYAWSADGRQIALLSWERGVREFCVLEADGSERHRLIESSMRVFQPRWTPDGQEIAFVGMEDDGRTSLYLVGADGSNLRLVTRLDDGLGFTLSLDGRHVAFMEKAPEPAEDSEDRETYTLAVMERDGSNRRVVADGIKGYFGHIEMASDVPRWLPDGRSLIYISHPDDIGGQMYMVTTDGAERRCLTENAGLHEVHLRLAYYSNPSFREHEIGPYRAPVFITEMRRGARVAPSPERIAAWGFWRKVLLCTLLLVGTPPITVAGTAGVDFGARGQVGLEVLTAVGALLVAVVPFFLGWRFSSKEPGVLSLVGVLCIFCLLMVGMILLIDALLYLAPLSEGVHFVFFMLGLLGVAIPLAGLLVYRLYNRVKAGQRQ